MLCRVDVRGTGSSEGVPEDEYPAVERTDMVTVIDWLATRDWSNGNVGMYGTSYSGFNSIQVAMERPPALKAIIPIYATDDRYTDDVHYFGGALKQLDQIDYPTYMVAIERPAAGTLDLRRRLARGMGAPGGRRRALDRPLARAPAVGRLLAVRLAEHRLRRDRMPDDDHRRLGRRLPEQLVPDVRGADLPEAVDLGPWAHAATDTSLPGPNHDLIPEHLKWWDHWLKGVDNGVDREPPIVLFAQRSTLPGPDRTAMNGEWRWEPTWPPGRLVPTTIELASAEANREGDGPDELDVRGDVGWTAWFSCAGAMPWGQPDDQRPDEIHSLTYTWAPLEDDLEILGHASLRVSVNSSAPIAYLNAKLCDVFPTGESSLVARGMLNLAHRESRAEPSPLEPGRPYEIGFDMEVASWTFEAGHRIHLDLAGTDWPNAWAPPEPLTLTIDRASAVLTLPVLDGPSPIEERPVLPPPKPESANQSPKERDRSEDESKGWVRWEVSAEQLKHETRAYAGSFGD